MQPLSQGAWRVLGTGKRWMGFVKMEGTKNRITPRQVQKMTHEVQRVEVHFQSGCHCYTRSVSIRVVLLPHRPKQGNGYQVCLLTKHAGKLRWFDL